MVMMSRGYIYIYIYVYVCCCDQAGQLRESGSLGRDGWREGHAYSEAPR
jgi:hypothetical protein